MNQLLIPVIVSLLLLIPISSDAKNSKYRERLDKTASIVRDDLISQGITAYKADKYHTANSNSVIK